MTNEGRRLLATQPLRVDNEMLMQFDSFRAFRGRGREETGETQPESSALTQTSSTPDEILRATHKELEVTLAAELLQRVRSGTPAFFERMIVN